MVGSNKILTVSYGTFSCTLEGFDDSFDTMKAIAEYFRDLAADDRYFGAEPPTPDAEMLARIAEREIARRVEAHEERGKIVLRAASEQAAMHTPLVAPAPAPQVTPEPERPESAPEMTQIAPAPQVVAEAAPEMVDTDETAQELANLPEETVAEVPETVASEAPDQPEGLEQEPRIAPAALAPDSESIAAKLSRIRSVVAQEAETADAEYSEDEHAQDFLDTVAEDLSAVLAEDDRAESAEIDDAEEDVDFDAILSAAPIATPAPQEVLAEQEPEAEETGADDFEDTLAALMADATPTDTETNHAPETTPQTPPLARVIKVKRAEFEAAVAEGIFEEDEDEDDDFDDDDDDNLFDTENTILSPEEEAELQRELAEVEAELALEDAITSDPEPEAEVTAQAAEDDEQPDAAEDTAAEAEPIPPVAADQDDLEDEDDVAATPVQEQETRRFEGAAASNDLTRIFDKTDTQLDAPASSQRRNAIQHLRAAVAATRAEHNAGSTLRENVDDAPYRSDLASVVRPRRPQIATPAERSARPEESRPAPLKLVAEQRIDTPRAPIRPRRISAADLEVDIAEQSKEGSFIAFAEEMGANSLPDLLEAAAAYLSDIEGRPQFSRPMLMGKLKEVEQERFSREDGLRSFGQLLRQGKLQKLAGGRFAVTEETEFRATGRRHAG